MEDQLFPVDDRLASSKDGEVVLVILVSQVFGTDVKHRLADDLVGIIGAKGLDQHLVQENVPFLPVLDENVGVREGIENRLENIVALQLLEKVLLKLLKRICCAEVQCKHGRRCGRQP